MAIHRDIRSRFDWLIIQKQTIKRFLLFLLLLLAAPSYLLLANRTAPLPQSAVIDGSERCARIKSLSGQVVVRRAATNALEEAVANTRINPGDTIQTANDATALIIYDDGSEYQIRPASTIIYKDDLGKEKNRKIENRLLLGDIKIVTSSQSGTQIIQLPSIKVNIKQNSDVVVITRGPGGKDTVEVMVGDVTVTNPRGSELIGPRERVEVVDNNINRSAILPAPEIMLPANADQLLVEDRKPIEFSWQPVEKADYYRFEISPVPSFQASTLTVNVAGLKENSYHWLTPGEGRYYWRVKAVSEAGSEGLWSESVGFSVRFQRKNNLPVRVTKINIIRFELVEIAGITKPHAFITINERKQLQADAGGLFKTSVSFPPTTRQRIIEILVVDNNGNTGRLPLKL